MDKHETLHKQKAKTGPTYKLPKLQMHTLILNLTGLNCLGPTSDYSLANQHALQASLAKENLKKKKDLRKIINDNSMRKI